MLESMAEWMSFPLYYAYEGAPPPPRAGAAHATIFPYGPFATGDGKSVMLGIQNEREWASFCAQVLMQPGLAKDERFSTNARRTQARDALRALIEAEFARLTAPQLVQRLEAAQIANAQVNTMADLWAHPQLAARERWTTVGTPIGPLPALWPPALPKDFDPRMDPIPALGQHTDTLLAELGHSPDDVASLRADGAI
jgi:itaconate CoA-transferase